MFVLASQPEKCCAACSLVMFGYDTVDDQGVEANARFLEDTKGFFSIQNWYR